MSDLLLEIYGEELPSYSQVLIENQLSNLFNEFFKESAIKFGYIKTFSTSRRVLILIQSVSKFTSEKPKELRGPQTDADKRAINGFLKSNNIISVNELQKKEIKGKFYFILNKKIKPKLVRNLLKQKVPEILNSIKWIKSMRWSNNNQRWIRPIRNIMCLLDNKIIKFEFAGVKSNNFTYGNYNFSEKKIKFLDFKSYKKKLKENLVILDRSEREKKITEKIKKFCFKNDLIFNVNKSLLRRVADSVEHPNVYFGTFDKSFFKLPNFLIENIITNKQDYFSFRDKKGNLSNNFCFISNIENKNKNRLRKGYENVLKARFSDAAFFIEEDLKIKLEKRLGDLDNITFYENTGTLLDRAKRIESLVKFIYKKHKKNYDDFTDQLILSNSDLTCELVKEFPNLQGMVGGYYASKENMNTIVCRALSDQYEYEFLDSNNNYLSFILSISQKFDAVIGYFISKKKLSGSGDPFGVRRSTLSIIRICIDKKIDINFFEFFNYLYSLYVDQEIDIDVEYDFIQQFIKKRMHILFLEMGFKQDIIEASFFNNEINPYLSFMRAKEITKLTKSENGRNFLKSFKRLDSLVEEIEGSEIINNLLSQKEEIDLNNMLSYLQKINISNHDEFFLNNYELLDKMTIILNQFFDNVIVNDSNEKVKQNRKILIREFHNRLNNSFNLSLLEI